MVFYYLTEKRKFDTEWEKLRAEYEAAGMDEESIEKMKAFDWGWFCSRRVYENHTQSLPDPEGYDDEEKSVLFRKFAALSVFFDENQSTDRFAWVEYIEDKALYERLRSFSFNDLELITMIAMVGMHTSGGCTDTWCVPKCYHTANAKNQKIFANHLTIRLSRCLHSEGDNFSSFRHLEK